MRSADRQVWLVSALSRPRSRGPCRRMARPATGHPYRHRGNGERGRRPAGCPL